MALAPTRELVRPGPLRSAPPHNRKDSTRSHRRFNRARSLPSPLDKTDPAVVWRDRIRCTVCLG